MNVFVYGTLMSPEVVTALLTRMPRHQPARLHRARRYGLKGYVFPAAVPAEETAVVQGLVLFDLTKKEADTFDEFEGDEYYKMDVRPRLLEDNSEVDASVYFWQDSARSMLHGEWDYERWRQCHMARYLEMCAQFKEELEAMLMPKNKPSTHLVEPVEDVHTRA